MYDIRIGEGTRFQNLPSVLTQQGAIVIGQNCRINARALAGPIQIGDNVLLNLDADISGRDHSVVIGNDVLIAPRVSILAAMHNYRDKGRLIREQGSSGGDVIIEDDVWIGTGAVVLPNVRIGRGAVIGANAVVTKDIPPFAVAIGIPATVTRFRGTNSDL
jgi:galactoside O-acetyltransferase